MRRKRWQWRRFAADAGRDRADVGADVAMGWDRGVAAVFALLHMGSAEDAARRRRNEPHAAAELKDRKQLEDQLTVAKHEAWILTDPVEKNHDHA